MIVVVDTNILFSAILTPEGTISDLLLNSQEKFQFIAPSYLMEELLRHESKIMKLGGYSRTEFGFLKNSIIRLK